MTIGISQAAVYLAAAADTSGAYTLAGLSGLGMTIGGVPCNQDGMMVLFANQANPSENGIVIVHGGAWEWTFPNTATRTTVWVQAGINQGLWYCNITDWSSGPSIWSEISPALSVSPESLRGTVATTDATPTNILSVPYAIPAGSCATVEAVVSVKSSDLSQTAAWKIIGLFKNVAGTVSQDGDTDLLSGPTLLATKALVWAGGTPLFTVSPAGVNVQAIGLLATNYTFSCRMTVYEN